VKHTYRIDEHGDALLTARPPADHSSKVFGEVRVHHLFV